MDNTRKHGIKDIHQAFIKATKPVVIYGKKYEPGDIVLYFTSIQQMNFQESLNIADAVGGFDNRSHVHWETTKEIKGAFDVGTISPLSFGLMNKNKLTKKEDNNIIPQFEETEVDDNGLITLKHIPLQEYKITINQVLQDTVINKKIEYELKENTLKVEESLAGCKVIIDYKFILNSEVQVTEIGRKDLEGFFMFVGKFYYTDEYTGVEKTGLIEIPKMRIDSNFQISVGRNTNPLISILQFTGLPINDRNNNYTLKVTYLDEDIDGDF